MNANSFSISIILLTLCGSGLAVERSFSNAPAAAAFVLSAPNGGHSSDGPAVTLTVSRACNDFDGDGYGWPGDPSCPNGPEDDCDDTAPGVNPGATEIPANGVDEDCNDHEMCYEDVDRDLYGSPFLMESPSADIATACDEPGLSWTNGDCNDMVPDINPGATEIPADGVDQDCDSQELCYEDLDSDGYGTSNTVVSPDLSCAEAGESFSSDDCNDADPDVNPRQIEICGDEVDQNCDGFGGDPTTDDEDGDGLTTVYEHTANPYITDECDFDSDDDGLGDAAEGAHLTDPVDADTDDDGLSDGKEVNSAGTDPVAPDSDGDFLDDGLELGRTTGIPGGTSDGAMNPVIYAGTAGAWTPDSDPGTTTDPLDDDSDDDGLTDGEEDGDADGYVDSGETDPIDADRDDDGLSDGEEENSTGTDPLDPDTDNDLLNDGLELGRTTGIPGGTSDGAMNPVIYSGTAGNWTPDSDPGTTTDPLDDDSDDDGALDGEEDADADGYVDPGETDPNVPDNLLISLLTREPWVEADDVHTGPSGVGSLTLLWSEPVLFDSDDVSITNEDAGAVPFSVSGSNSQFMIIEFGEVLLNDEYTVTIRDSVVSAGTGTAIDGDDDGLAGGDVVLVMKHRNSFDNDRDGDVDLADFAAFQVDFIGPLP